jgi:glycosyltransferase involved in cell wall biosynthesis
VSERAIRRRREVDEHIDNVALGEFQQAHGSPVLSPVAIVIAAYKERDNIGQVLEGIPEKICELAVSVIVVIDGEEDGTAEIVRRTGYFAVIAPVNRGQGAALRLGYRVARTFGAQYIITADGDGQTDPNELSAVLEPVLHNRADFVNGSRRLGTTHSKDTVRNTGVFVYAAIISFLTHTKVTDTANPVRAMRAELTARLILDEPQYQASEVLIGAIMGGARFMEAPITMRVRATGKSKKGGNLLYGVRYGRVVFRTYVRERRRRSKARLRSQPNP